MSTPPDSTLPKNVGPETYNILGRDYALTNASNAWNAFFERPSSLALLPSIKGLSVLDLGCGPGAGTEALVNLGAKVTAVDGSDVMVEIARERLGDRAQISVHNLENPFTQWQSGSFDAILCSLTIHYVKNLSGLIQEMNRVLKPGAIAVVSTEHPAFSHQDIPGNRYLETHVDISQFNLQGKSFSVPVYRRSLTEMLSSFLENGFQLEAISEGILTEELGTRFPREFEMISRRPPFLFLKWSARVR